MEKNNFIIPTVVLAGRPNVGKSTLFNRLLKKRRAITDPTPGVTRDPVAMETVILGRKIRLIDTGGFKLERDTDTPEGSLDAEVVERTLKTLKEASLILLIFEAGEVTAEDEEFIGLLRPYRDHLIAVVNKTEGGRREADAWNLLSYGFEKIFMISAEHGDNIGALESAIIDFLKFPEEGEISCDEPVRDNIEDRPIRIALLGKPNTGKSTLSNRLTASASSIVSDIPGTTRDVVEGGFVYKNRKFRTLDTAGIRRKTKVSENIEYYSVNRAIKSIDEADIIFLLIDAEEGLTDQDKKIAALAHDKGRGIILTLNKWDLMPQIKNTFQAAQDRIRFLFGKMEYAPVAAVSAKDGAGVEELLNTAIRMYNQLCRKIETSALNQALEKWLEEYPPPSGPRTRFKIRYAVQVSSNPVKFVFFVSRRQAVTEPYIAYLRNRIRRDLGFSLIPVQIELRSSSGRSRE
ncbi:MAG: ribosome biogenesis GTPase Der [Treponema sp.]|jgi:GTP-binding protein|nr:ribosome biogenesis GTPase Der [Treponema sp.]